MRMDLRGLRSALSWRESERTAEDEQLRTRVLAFGGLWLLLAGLLAALGIWIFFVASIALLVAGGVAVAALSFLQRDGPRERVLGIAHSMERASRNLDGRLGELDLRQRVQRSAGVASRRARGFAVSRRKEPAEADPSRRARRLNRLGVELRREGRYEQAAEQHLAALALARELGDRGTEALTLNNLALALVQTDGGVPLANERFEQAIVLLRQLGDDEHEGQVIANLASVRRRQGRDEDAEYLLHAALDKLPPESSAYRQVEEQLRRAS
jgi:tetratricopeptide (TPR) repeat protein